MQRALHHLLEREKQAKVAASAAPASSPRLSLPKIPAPSKFRGESGFRVDDWIRELQRQFDYYDQDFVTDSARVKYAMAFMDELAADWWAVHQPRMLKEEQDQGRPLVITWARFVQELQQRFRPLQGALVARQTLDHLQQGSLSVDIYAHRFQAVLTPITDMSEADKVFRFVTNLRSGLKQRVLQEGPQTLEDAIKTAASHEAAYRFSKPLTAQTAMRYATTSRGDASGSAPMDVNNVESSGVAQEEASGSSAASTDSVLESLAAKLMERVDQRINAVMQSRRPGNGQRRSNDRVDGLTQQELERCLRSGLCFFCKEANHMKRDCPKRSQSAAAKAGK